MLSHCIPALINQMFFVKRTYLNPWWYNANPIFLFELCFSCFCFRCSVRAFHRFKDCQMTQFLVFFPPPFNITTSWHFLWLIYDIFSVPCNDISLLYQDLDIVLIIFTYSKVHPGVESVCISNHFVRPAWWHLVMPVLWLRSSEAQQG